MGHPKVHPSTHQYTRSNYSSIVSRDDPWVTQRYTPALIRRYYGTIVTLVIPRYYGTIVTRAYWCVLGCTFGWPTVSAGVPTIYTLAIKDRRLAEVRVYKFHSRWAWRYHFSAKKQSSYGVSRGIVASIPGCMHFSQGLWLFSRPMRRLGVL